MSKRTKKRRRAKSGCSGKVRHKTLHGARIAARLMGIADVVPYGPCKHCGGFHIGHSAESHHIQDRLDQLLNIRPPRPAPDPHADNSPHGR